MSGSSEFLSKAILVTKQAIEADNKEQYDEAYRLYGNGLDYFMMALKYENSPSNKEVIRSKLIEYLARAELLKEFLKNSSAQTSNNQITKLGKGNSTIGQEDSETKELKLALSSAIISESPNVKWEDVAGLDGAKEALKEAVLLPLRLPHLFTKRKPWSGILLYGPPGTGKSHLAKAVATEAKSTFFSVSSSDLVSKWMGQSEKLVRQLFQMARESRPAIIFVDEIDALAGTRGEGETEASRRIKTEFLVQMNGVGNDTAGVLVLGATNIPWTLDSAIRRRFEKRIYIPLPDVRARARLFRLGLGEIQSNLNHQDFTKLAEVTEGYSGSDISIAVRDAIMEPIRKIHTATHFKKVFNEDSNRYMPCSPGDEYAEEISWQDIRPEDLVEPPITIIDFNKAVKKAKPTLNQADINKHVEFTKNFGQEG